MVSVQRSFYFILLLFFNVGSINSAQLKIQTLDFLTGEPVPGVDVILRHRLITNDDDGESQLEPLDLNPILSSARTDTAGFATFELDLASSTFLVIELSPRDHECQTLTLLPIDPSDRIDRTFRLLPRNPTPAQDELIIDLHKSERATHVVEQGPFVPPPSGQLHATAVNVPDQVRVQNLNGFTGMMNLDEFIGGVVTAEMNDGFPREALRAQAVASRSYALHRLRTLGYANGGQAFNPVSGSLSRAASVFTSKKVLLYNGSIAQTFFSARCNGDFTLNSEDGPTLDRCFRGGLTTTVVPYCRSKPCSGHINCSVTSERCCSLVINNKMNYIYGHGIGLCQRGAQQFASRDSLSYATILNRFYTAVTLHTGTNSLQLSIVSQQTQSGEIRPLLQISSGQPDTRFDLQSTTTLIPSSWSSVAAEQNLTTGPSSSTQIQPLAPISNTRYFRAVLR